MREVLGPYVYMHTSVMLQVMKLLGAQIKLLTWADSKNGENTAQLAYMSYTACW